MRFSISIFASLSGSVRLVGTRLPADGTAFPRAIPTVPVEVAVPAEFVPGVLIALPLGALVPRPLFPDGLATFAALAPLGSFPELLRPAASVGRFGVPFTAVVPALTEAALVEPAELAVPAVGLLAAPVVPELAAPAAPPAAAPTCTPAGRAATTTLRERCRN